MCVLRLYRELLRNRVSWARSLTGLLTSSHKNVYVLSETPNLYLNPFRQISTSSVVIGSEKKKEHSFTVLYLIDSCGLSREAAYVAAKKVQFESSEKPDSVLNLLKEHGFTETHIAILIRKRPLLLIVHPYRTLKPKLDFFGSVGLSPLDLAGLICSKPSVIEYSLVRRIVPTFEFLRGIVGTNKDVITVIKRCFWVMLRDFKRFMLPNIMVLRSHGVPESCIASLTKSHPGSLMHKPERFNLIVNEVKKMGFDPHRYTFVRAVQVMLGMRKSIWKQKMEFYRKWGWSEDDFFLAFKRLPVFMTISEENAKQKMDFLVNKFGANSVDIAKCPAILMYCLKRITSRCFVIKLLLSKNLIKKNPSLWTVLISGEGSFLKKFVTKYCLEVPELLNFYRMDMVYPASAFQSERRHGTNDLAKIHLT